MAELMLALVRSAASLRQARVWSLILAPAVLSLLLWGFLLYTSWSELVDWLLGMPPFSVLMGWEWWLLAKLLAYGTAWMVLFALVYLTASLLAAVWVLPLLLNHLAAGAYRDVARQGRDSFWSALSNSLSATFRFVVWWLLSLPLWLIPGFSVLVPLWLMARLNQRSFAYDALAQHATDAEWAELRQRQSGPGWLLGLLLAVLAHVPVIGLLVPALAALAYCHLGLEGVRQLRARHEGSVHGDTARGITIEGEWS